MTLLVLLAAGVARLALPTLVERWLVATLREGVGIELSLDDLSLDVANGRATVLGIRADIGGKPLARCTAADVDTDLAALVRGDDADVRIVLHGLEGEIRVEPDHRLNVARIADAIDAADDGTPPGEQRITLLFRAADARLRYSDTVSAPESPLELTATDVRIAVSKLAVSGPDRPDELLDVYASGLVTQPEEPAIFAFGLWEGPDPQGRYLEAHAAVTAFDGRLIPQYLTPGAKRILGGDLLHASGTVVAHRNVIQSGLVELEVEGARSSLPLRFGGTLDDVRFDMDSPVLQVFRLGALRVVDSGDAVLATGRSFGESIWRRSTGVVTRSAQGVSDAATDLSLRKLAQGLWRGISGLFGAEPDKEERLARWITYAERQIAFRELVVQRRLEVAREREPGRVGQAAEWAATRPWEAQIASLRRAAEAAAEDAARGDGE